MRHVTHLSIGDNTFGSAGSACGYTSLWHRGLFGTKQPEQVTCRRCRRWMKNNPDILDTILARYAKNVTPASA